MKAIDTNVLVRAVLRDDEAQTARADAVIAAGELLVLPTVLVEVEWVLRASYRLPRHKIAQALVAICSLPGMVLASRRATLAAVAAYAKRGDFADLLHSALAAEAGAEAMVTFDRRFASPPGGIAVELLAG